MKKIKYLLFILLVILSTASYAMKLRPIGFDKRIDEGNGFQEFTVTNTSSEIMRFKAFVKSTGKDTDISKLISIYPKVFTVEPLSEKTFKVYVEETQLPKGEYSFILGVQPVKMPKIEEEKKGKIDSSVSMQIAMQVEMMAYSGEMKDKFDIVTDNFYKQDGKKFYKAHIKNNMGRGVELAVGYTDKVNNIIDLKPLGRLFNGNGTIFNIEVPKEAKNIIFYDYNNYKVIGQSIKVR
nr:hypothetical protein [uncultured Fusobacterium sp.]